MKADRTNVFALVWCDSNDVATKSENEEKINCREKNKIVLNWKKLKMHPREIRKLFSHSFSICMCFHCLFRTGRKLKMKRKKSSLLRSPKTQNFDRRFLWNAFLILLAPLFVIFLHSWFEFTFPFSTIEYCAHIHFRFEMRKKSIQACFLRVCTFSKIWNHVTQIYLFSLFENQIE